MAFDIKKIIAGLSPVGAPPLVTVRDVEICATGIEYPLASGPQTFTEDDLVDAVMAQDDPAVSQPRTWLGHIDDDRFHVGRAKMAKSAEPSLGTVTNMRMSEDNQTIIGDIEGVPRWLANILGTAYPNRSIEGYMEAETVTGKKWRLVITDLALLGVRWPGVSTLEDLQILFYSEETPEGIVLEEMAAVEATTGGEGMSLLKAARKKMEASVNVDDVRRAYYDTLGPAQEWWWVRSIILDDNGENVLIVDDDAGELYRVPFTISGDTVEFGDPTEVKVEYAPVAAGRGEEESPKSLGLIVSGGRLAASFTSRADSRPESTTEEESPMGMTVEQIRTLRERTGLSEEQLPDNATDEQINSALGAIPQPAATPPEGSSSGDGDGSGEGTQEGTPAEGDGVPEGQEQLPLAAQAAAPKTVEVPAEEWARVQANAAAGAQVAAQSEDTRRSGIVAAAVKEGRIAPAQRSHFENMFKSDPAGTEKLLTAKVEDGGLMPGTIPVEARGQDIAATGQADDAYDPSWLPELQAQGAGAGPVTREEV